jgi:hypothetical protein
VTDQLERQPQRVRIAEIAERAGVSPKSVSNVVHGRPAVSTQLRQRVESAIRELGYVPNLHARNLKAGLTGKLTLEVPENADDEASAALYRALVNACTRRGYLLEIVVARDAASPGPVGDGILRYRLPVSETAGPPVVPLGGTRIDPQQAAEAAISALVSRIETDHRLPK